MNLELLFFIKDACERLPAGYDLNVNFSLGDMHIELTDQDGGLIEIECPMVPVGDAGFLQYAINTARRYAGLSEFYHESLIDHRIINEQYQ